MDVSGRLKNNAVASGVGHKSGALTAAIDFPKENPGTIAVVTEVKYTQEATQLPASHNMPGPIIAMHWGVAA